MVTVTTAGDARSTRDWEAVAMAREAIEEVPNVPTIHEVRAALSVIPGSLSSAVTADRGDY